VPARNADARARSVTLSPAPAAPASGATCAWDTTRRAKPTLAPTDQVKSVTASGRPSRLTRTMIAHRPGALTTSVGTIQRPGAACVVDVVSLRPAGPRSVRPTARIGPDAGRRLSNTLKSTRFCPGTFGDKRSDSTRPAESAVAITLPPVAAAGRHSAPCGGADDASAAAPNSTAASTAASTASERRENEGSARRRRRWVRQPSRPARKATASLTSKIRPKVDINSESTVLTLSPVSRMPVTDSPATLIRAVRPKIRSSPTVSLLSSADSPFPVADRQCRMAVRTTTDAVPSPPNHSSASIRWIDSRTARVAEVAA